MLIREEIGKIIDEFTDKDGVLHRYCKTSPDANLVERFDDLEEQYNINVIETSCFENSSYEVGTISVAYYDLDAEFCHEVYMWEVL